MSAREPITEQEPRRQVNPQVSRAEAARQRQQQAEVRRQRRRAQQQQRREFAGEFDQYQPEDVVLEDGQFRIRESARRRELQEDVLEQAGAGYTPQDIEFTETEEGLRATITGDAQRRELRETVLERAGEDFTAEDVEFQQIDGELQARIEPTAQREALQQDVLEQVGEEYTAEDIQFDETDGGLEASITEEAYRRELREQAAAESDTLSPEDITVEETDGEFRTRLSDTAEDRLATEEIERLEEQGFTPIPQDARSAVRSLEYFQTGADRANLGGALSASGAGVSIGAIDEDPAAIIQGLDPEVVEAYGDTLPGLDAEEVREAQEAFAEVEAVREEDPSEFLQEYADEEALESYSQITQNVAESYARGRATTRAERDYREAVGEQLGVPADRISVDRTGGGFEVSGLFGEAEREIQQRVAEEQYGGDVPAGQIDVGVQEGQITADLTEQGVESYFETQLAEQTGEDLTAGEDFVIEQTDQGRRAEFTDAYFESRLEEQTGTELAQGEDFVIEERDGAQVAQFTEGYQREQAAESLEEQLGVDVSPEDVVIEEQDGERMARLTEEAQTELGGETEASVSAGEEVFGGAGPNPYVSDPQFGDDAPFESPTINPYDPAAIQVRERVESQVEAQTGIEITAADIDLGRVETPTGEAYTAELREGAIVQGEQFGDADVRDIGDLPVVGLQAEGLSRAAGLDPLAVSDLPSGVQFETEEADGVAGAAGPMGVPATERLTGVDVQTFEEGTELEEVYRQAAEGYSDFAEDVAEANVQYNPVVGATADVGAALGVASREDIEGDIEFGTRQVVEFGNLPQLTVTAIEAGEFADYAGEEITAGRGGVSVREYQPETGFGRTGPIRLEEEGLAPDVIEAGEQAVSSAVEFAREDPSRFAVGAGASLAGSAFIMGGAAQISSRAGLASRAIIQPGEEALGYGGYYATRAVSGTRTAERFFPQQEPLIFSEEAAIRGAQRISAGARRRYRAVRDVARGETAMAEVSTPLSVERARRFRPGGPSELAGGEATVVAGRSEPLGGLGTGPVLETEVVDEAMGATGGVTEPPPAALGGPFQVGFGRPAVEVRGELEEQTDPRFDPSRDYLLEGGTAERARQEMVERQREARRRLGGDYEGEFGDFETEIETQPTRRRPRTRREAEARRRRRFETAVEPLGAFDQPVIGTEPAFRVDQQPLAFQDTPTAQLPGVEPVGRTRAGVDTRMDTRQDFRVATDQETRLFQEFETETEQPAEFRPETETFTEQEQEQETEFEFETETEQELEAEFDDPEFREWLRRQRGGFAEAAAVTETGILSAQEVAEAAEIDIEWPEPPDVGGGR